MINILRRCAYLVFSLLSLTSPAEAQNENCSEMTKVEELALYDDLFIGEIHGTVEVSRFLKCLIDKSIELGDEEIVVSLEMAEIARNLSSPFWKTDNFEDGRSSEAMFNLVQSLVGMEEDGVIKLHFQHGAMGSASPKRTGEELRVLAAEHKVIALAGNMHSRKRPPAEYSNMAVEGMFVGPSFVHVMVTSTKGGEAWICAGVCGVTALAPWPTGSVATDSLIDGEPYEHDLVYFLATEKVSASKPVNIGDE